MNTTLSVESIEVVAEGEDEEDCVEKHTRVALSPVMHMAGGIDVDTIF
jgi:hypothetical protein